MRAPLLFAVLTAASAAAHADITVDGRADEAEWANAQRFGDFVQIQPLSETPVPEQFATEAMLLSTPAGIAVYIKAKQPPDVPRTKTRVARDAEGQIDRMNFMVDFDGEGRSGFDFTVTMAGDISDAVISNENQFNTDWDGDWQHAVYEDDVGYSIEWLIPWSIAPMKNSGTQTRTIGVFFSRVIAVTGERWAYPNAVWTRPRYLNDFHRIDIPQFSSSLFSFTPYLVASRDIANDGSEYKAGMDLFWKPSGDHQFAATINPDFGQVESDQLVVNFDAIETFYTDKRPFFTENQAYFEVNNPGGQLFYTRRVGGPSDDGAGAANIDAAVKANGSFGDLGYGVFAASEDGEAGRDFLMARATHVSDDLTLGFTQTHVDRPFFDRIADVGSIDARWRPNAQWSVQAALMHSDTETAGVSKRDFGGGVIADWDMPGPWRQQYFLIHVGNDMELNDLGFQDRNNFLLAEWESGYRQDNLPAESMFASHQYEFEVQRQTDDHGLTLRESYAAMRQSEVRDGGNMFLLARYLRPAWDDLISRGHGAIRRQSGPAFFVERSVPRQGTGWFGWYANIEIAPNLHDGYYLYGGVQPKFHIGDRFDIDVGLFGMHQQDWVVWQGGSNFGSFKAERAELSSNLNWFIDDTQELRIKLQAIAIDAEAIAMRTPDSNGSLVATASSLSDFSVRNLGFQIRYRYKLGPLSDVFAVYSRGGFERENLQSGDSVGVILGDTFALDQDDQFLVKLAYRFAP
ncbi:MAG TPA: DUF5916 domain-containing protein [Pseudomonadota bacterium]|nr:hypothetical protein [Xanthomonadales bacterium]HQW81059.1 DUF5916 domain-containing protein [Pseudomonadota bacterium]